MDIRYLSINTTRPPFDDVCVRQTFALALNRRQLTDVVLRTGGTPAYTVIKALPGGYEPIAEARRLLADAGYPDGVGFPPVEYLYNTLDRNREMAEALQQIWRTALNINVSLRNEEWKVFLDTRQHLNYQIARAGWLPFSAEPLELYELQTAASGSNETGWIDPAYEEHYATALRTMDAMARRRHYAAMDHILHDQMPVIPIGHYARARLVHSALIGWPENHLEGLVWTRLHFSSPTP
ncbi:MAG: hypothetical protein J6386_14040 [Candidatus Synoicihabitans palmerolidicus]|nr:hypothetical protein [Candidatus Synoicihabitans palmerolidicus]